MSKKLIAVASAAALALTALVGIAPASANGTLAITDFTPGGAGTTASPYKIPVPSANTLVAGTNALTVTISNLATGDVVRVDSTGGFKLIESIADLGTENQYINVSTLGATTYSKTTTSNVPVVIYAYTTGIAVGTIASTLTRAGISSTNSVTVQGTAGAAYNMSALVAAPTVLALAGTADLTFTATDVFGNPVENSNIIVGDTTGVNLGTVSWDSTAKVYKTKMTSPSDSAFLYSYDFDAGTDIVGFAKSKDNVSGVVNYSGDATLRTANAALIADYNALATKWNKKVKFKRNRVTLK
jgi:hypothetical protein